VLLAFEITFFRPRFLSSARVLRVKVISVADHLDDHSRDVSWTRTSAQVRMRSNICVSQMVFGLKRCERSIRTRIASAGSLRLPMLSAGAFLFAEVCEVKRTARVKVPSLPLAPELEPPNRAGPTDAWAKFDHAREALGGALADNNRMAVARAFKDIAQAVAEVADALDVPDGPR
jgi:hypothetical protein